MSDDATPPFAAAESPLVHRAWSFVGRVPFIRKGLHELLDTHGLAWRVTAEEHLEQLNLWLGDDDALDQSFEHFVRLTFDTLKMQNVFFRTGKISPYTAEERAEKVHENEELMGGPYLQGLYLAHILWPNHWKKLQFFQEHFVPVLPEHGRMLDVGSGPGTYTVLCRKARPAMSLLSIDISPLSGRMVRGLEAAALGAGTTGMDCVVGDFTLRVQTEAPYDCGIFSEIVEHLPTPDEGMRRLHQGIKAGGPIFFSTATNAAFYDHYVIYESIQAIEQMLRGHGFTIRSSGTAKIFDGPDGKDVVDYYAVITPDS